MQAVHLTLRLQHYSVCLSISDNIGTAVTDILLACSGFQVYETLSQSERAELVDSATQCVSAWLVIPLVAPQPQHSLEAPQGTGDLPPLPSSQQQQQQQQHFERQQSGTTASTSHLLDALGPSHKAGSELHTTNGALHARNTSAPDRRQQYSTSTQLPSITPQEQSSSHTMGLLQQHPAASNNEEHLDSSAAVSAVEAARQDRPLDDVMVLGEELQPAHVDDAYSLSSTDQNTILPSEPPQPAARPTEPKLSASSEPFHQAHELEDTAISILPLQHLSVHEQPSSLQENHSRNDSSQPEDQSASSIEEHPEGKGQRAVKAETLAFQASFAQAAAVNMGTSLSPVDFAAAGQRTEVWHAMRQGRLTASSFANALGYGFIVFFMLKPFTSFGWRAQRIALALP